jgi:hypothetical protein
VMVMLPPRRFAWSDVASGGSTLAGHPQIDPRAGFRRLQPQEADSRHDHRP